MADLSLIQMRRDTTANWASTNPVLTSGEWGLDVDLQEIKLGDGSTPWLTLPFYSLWKDETSDIYRTGNVKVKKTYTLSDEILPALSDGNWAFTDDLSTDGTTVTFDATKGYGTMIFPSANFLVAATSGDYFFEYEILSNDNDLQNELTLLGYDSGSGNGLPNNDIALDVSVGKHKVRFNVPDSEIADGTFNFELDALSPLRTDLTFGNLSLKHIDTEGTDGNLVLEGKQYTEDGVAYRQTGRFTLNFGETRTLISCDPQYRLSFNGTVITSVPRDNHGYDQATAQVYGQRYQCSENMFIGVDILHGQNLAAGVPSGNIGIYATDDSTILIGNDSIFDPINISYDIFVAPELQPEELPA